MAALVSFKSDNSALCFHAAALVSFSWSLFKCVTVSEGRLSDGQGN